MQETIAFKKSYTLAVAVCIELIKIQRTSHQYSLTDQLIRSSSSVHANLRESRAAQSTRDFIAKLSISHKESEESQYWLELLHDIGLLEDRLFKLFHPQFIELSKLLAASLISLKRKVKGAR